MRSFTLTAHENTPVLLLHPNLQGYGTFLPDLLKQGGRLPLYLALQPSSSSAAGFCQRLGAILREQAKIDLPDLSHPTTPIQYIRRAAETLPRIAPFCLVIDGIDVLDEVSTAPLLRILTEHLPQGCQIVLSGRRLPVRLLEDTELRARVTLAPVDEALMFPDYLQPRDGKTLLEVHAFGPGRALVNGKTVGDWDGILPRNLFLFMVDRNMATRDDIFRAFWPTLSIREATNVFHVTKRKISEILGFDLTIYGSGYYQIAPKIDLHYDVFKFIEAVQNGSIQDNNTGIETLNQALQVFRGDYLSGNKADWAVERRGELRLMYADALSTLSTFHARSGDKPRADALFSRAQAMSSAL